eukprot:3403731-Heterocapsa_arctica.AAC.1
MLRLPDAVWLAGLGCPLRRLRGLHRHPCLPARPGAGRDTLPMLERLRRAKASATAAGLVKVQAFVRPLLVLDLCWLGGLHCVAPFCCARGAQGRGRGRSEGAHGAAGR